MLERGGGTALSKPRLARLDSIFYVGVSQVKDGATDQVIGVLGAEEARSTRVYVGEASIDGNVDRFGMRLHEPAPPLLAFLERGGLLLLLRYVDMHPYGAARRAIGGALNDLSCA
jgi:hypothetical protein